MKKIRPLILVVMFFVGFLISANHSLAQNETAVSIQDQIKILLKQIEELKTKLYALQGESSQWCYDFNENLKIWSSGYAVSTLRTALSKEGFNINKEEGDQYFGEIVAAAVSGFQQKYKDEILTPNGLQYGTGFAGKSTRAKLNKLYGCGSSLSSSSSNHPVESMNDWKNYTNLQYGFEFKYPVGWNITSNDAEGNEYKVIARVVNPARAGKPDTDVPIEQFLVRIFNYPCKGKPISLMDGTITDTGWSKGFGNINYRDRCFKKDDKPITVSLSAFDQPSLVIMEQILSTFRFIKSPASSSSSSSQIQQSLSITNPLGGHLWKLGDTQTFQWTTSGIASNVIGYINIVGNGSTYSIYNVPNTGSYTWKPVGDVKGSSVPAGVYSVKIIMNGVGDIVGPLTIASSSSIPSVAVTVVSPNGGEKLEKGATYQITWSAVNFGSLAVDIDLVDNNGYITRNIVNNIANSGSYTWSIPQDLPSGSYKILVSSFDKGPSAQDYSDNYFTIFSSSSSSSSSSSN